MPTWSFKILFNMPETFFNWCQLWYLSIFCCHQAVKHITIQHFCMTNSFPISTFFFFFKVTPCYNNIFWKKGKKSRILTYLKQVLQVNNSAIIILQTTSGSIDLSYQSLLFCEKYVLLCLDMLVISFSVYHYPIKPPTGSVWKKKI